MAPKAETAAAPVNPLDALLNLITTKTEAANKIADEAKTALGNTAKDIKEARENSDDPQVVAFREWAEQHAAAYNAAVEAINKHITDTGIVSGASWDAETAEAKKAEHKTIVKSVKDAKAALGVTYKALGMAEPEYPELRNFSGSVAKAGGSTGIRRPRFDKVVLNGVTLPKATLSAVSQEVKSKTGQSVSASDLLDMLAKQAGVSADNLVGLNDTTVEFTETDKEKVNHTFTLTVYKDQPVEKPEAEAAKSE